MNLGWLMGADVQKNIDHAVSGLDKMVFTKEEKSDVQMKLIQIKIAAAAKQSVPRRILATVTVAVWAFLIVVGVTAQGFGMDDFADYVFNVLKDTVGQPHSIIVGFYFLKEVVGSWSKGSN